MSRPFKFDATEPPRCPYCGVIYAVTEDFGDGEERAPRPGDPSVCGGCLEIAVFDSRPSRRGGTVFEMRRPTPFDTEEFRRAGLTQRIEAARAAVQLARFMAGGKT